jgi:hypothetical protein
MSKIIFQLTKKKQAKKQHKICKLCIYLSKRWTDREIDGEWTERVASSNRKDIHEYKFLLPSYINVAEVSFC